jgi:FkbM family methyltransferase
MTDDEARKMGLDPVRTVKVLGRDVRYVGRGWSNWRFDTLMTKEPDTIEWIDGFKPDDILWDIGANIGIYCIYAALRGVRVFAFEPSFSNYFVLCANIALNGMGDMITPLCVAFSDTKAVGSLRLGSLDIGSSGSNFSASATPRKTSIFQQGMIGFDIDSFVAEFGMTVPTHVKIDVDGIEPYIVKGGAVTFGDPKLQSVSVELDEKNTSEVSAVSTVLEGAGLHLAGKGSSVEFNAKHNIKGFDTTMNFQFRR